MCNHRCHYSMAVVLILWMGLMSMSVGAQTNMSGLLEHPCALLNGDMLEQVRANAADAEVNRFGFSSAEIWQALLAEADKFLNAPSYSYQVNIPRRDGGPAVPWEYTLSDATPPPHDVPTYPPWTAMTQEQRDDAITVRIKSLSFAYLVTGDARYAEAARKMVMHLTKWTHWTDRSYGAGQIKACLDTGHLTKCVGLFYDWCHDTLSEADRAAIRDALVEKGINMILEDVGRYAPQTNGYAVLVSGLACAAVAIRPEDPRGGEYLAQAIELTRAAFDLFGKDGGLFEGPGYGTYLLDNFAHVLDAVTAAQVDSDLFEHPFLSTMAVYAISNLTPDGRVMPNFSDGRPVAGYPETMSILANRGCADSAWYLQQINSIKPSTLHQFLRFNPEVMNFQQPTFNPSRPFVDIGYGILRDGYKPHRPFLAFKSGPFNTHIGHNHFDHNSFVISYLGEWLIADRGYRARYKAEETKFSQGAMGHSTVVLNIDDGYMLDTTHPHPGHDQLRTTGGKIEKFFSSEPFDYIQGQAAAPYNTEDRMVLDDYRRNIFYFKPHLFVMVDYLSAPEPHSYNITLQAGPQSICERVDGDAWTITGRKAQLGCWLYGPEGTATEALTYPGAERYGQFIRAYTPKMRQAQFVTLMRPRAFYTSSLVRNGGFEEGMVGWNPRANEDLPNHVIDTEVKRSGQASGRIDGSGYYYSPRIQVEPGTRLKASVWLKTTDTTQRGGTVAIYFYGAQRSFAQERSQELRPDDWTLVEVEAVAPEGTVSVCMGLNYFGDGVGWYDDASFEMLDQLQERLQAGEMPRVTSLADGQRGVTAILDQTRMTLLTAGGPVQAGEQMIQHDGTFAALSSETSWSYVYLQEGRFLAVNGQEIIRVAGQEPATVAVWRGQGGQVHVLMADSLIPHSPARAPEDVMLQVFSSEPITGAYCGDTALSVKADGMLHTIGG